MATELVSVRLAGRGGQGIMLAAYILAQAAIYDGLEVVQTQSYGPEARLGAAKSDVIVSSHEIAFPEVVDPDVLLCLSRDAYVAYGSSRRRDRLRVLDLQVARELEIGREEGFVLPLARAARELGAPFAANIVALGAIVALSDVVAEEALREALHARVTADSFGLNSRALAAGLRLGADARDGRSADVVRSQAGAPGSR